MAARSHTIRPIAKLLLPEFPTPSDLRATHAYWRTLGDSEQRSLLSLPFLPLAARLKDAIRQRCSCSTCQFSKCSFLSQPGDEALELRFAELRNGQPLCRCGACNTTTSSKRESQQQQQQQHLSSDPSSSSSSSPRSSDSTQPILHLNRECLIATHSELCSFAHLLCIRHEDTTAVVCFLHSTSCSHVLEQLIAISTMLQHLSLTAKDLIRSTCTACAATVATDLYWAAGVARNILIAARQEAADLAFRELLNEPKAKNTTNAAKKKKQQQQKQKQKQKKQQKKSSASTKSKLLDDTRSESNDSHQPMNIQEPIAISVEPAQQSGSMEEEEEEEEEVTITSSLASSQTESVSTHASNGASDSSSIDIVDEDSDEQTNASDAQPWTCARSRSRRTMSPNPALPSPPMSPPSGPRLPSEFLVKLAAQLPPPASSPSSSATSVQHTVRSAKPPSPYRPHFLHPRSSYTLAQAEERVERENQQQQCHHPCVVPGCATMCDIPAHLIHSDHSCVKSSPCSQSCRSANCAQHCSGLHLHREMVEATNSLKPPISLAKPSSPYLPPAPSSGHWCIEHASPFSLPSLFGIWRASSLNDEQASNSNAATLEALPTASSLPSASAPISAGVQPCASYFSRVH